jgi:hypothetical protein
MASYATVDDYELRTGTDVPDDMEPTIQARLDDVSNLIQLYLGDCATAVETQFPEILTSLTVAHTYKASSIPAGVRSESVGSTSVSYDVESGAVNLISAETDLLDRLMAEACEDFVNDAPGVGMLGIKMGGVGDEEAYDHWAADIDVWVI